MCDSYIGQCSEKLACPPTAKGCLSANHLDVVKEKMNNSKLILTK